jgi:hypothetical protein
VRLDRFSWVLFGAVFFPSACARGPDREAFPEDAILEERAKEYFDERFRFYPVEATAAGLHTHDSELGRFTESQMKSRVSELRDFRQRLLGIDLTKLSRPAFIDALLLTSAVKAELFELEEVEPWRRSPRFYSDIICSGIWSLLERGDLPALLSRLDQVPELLESASQNVESPAPILVEDGIAHFRNCQQIFVELPSALNGFLYDELRAQIEEASLEARDSIERFIAHLETNVTRGSVDSFRLGEDRLRGIRLLGESRLSETKERMKQIAASTNSPLPLAGLLTEVASRRMAAGEILPFTEELLQDLRQFALRRDIASSLTYAPDPAVKEALFLPGRARAFLDTPGPMETSGDAVFRLALPAAESSGGDRLLPFEPYTLQLVSMHEVYPGNYLRFLSRNESPSRVSDVRRLVTSRANRDGWAHYAEEMFLDQGYGSADPLLRLVQLHRALVKQCRLVTTILLHAEGLSLPTATRIFMNEAYLDRGAAEREARAVACDANRMSAALGKMQILKLRRDYFEAEGDAKTLRDFHEAFLSLGEPPLRLVRLLLLPDTEGETLPD